MSDDAASARLDLLVNIDVDDLARGIAFYTSAFGLRVGRRFVEPAVELLGAACRLYLLEKKAGSPATASAASSPRHYERHWTPVHVDLVVPDIEPALERAVQAGATIEQPIDDTPYGRIAMIADPFGHGWCLLELNAQGYDADGI